MCSHPIKPVHLLVTFALVFLITAIGACSKKSDDSGVLGSPQSGGPTWPEEKLNTVNVSLLEFQINMPNRLPPGPTKFVVTNDGEDSHNFTIEGPGGQRTLAAKPLKPREKAQMQIDLKPGKYTVYCPVFNHRDRGMKVDLTVTAE